MIETLSQFLVLCQSGRGTESTVNQIVFFTCPEWTFKHFIMMDYTLCLNLDSSMSTMCLVMWDNIPRAGPYIGSIGKCSGPHPYIGAPQMREPKTHKMIKLFFFFLPILFYDCYFWNLPKKGPYHPSSTPCSKTAPSTHRVPLTETWHGQQLIRSHVKRPDPSLSLRTSHLVSFQYMFKWPNISARGKGWWKSPETRLEH